MGIATLAAITDGGEPIKIQVNDEGQLVVETAATPLAMEMLSKMDAIITKLDAVAVALDQQ